jgi:putative tryptophan/tyrosine transport system substrate-binding protein
VVSLKFAIRNSKSTILAGAILIALCSLLLALCSSIEAQPTGKIFRIGYLDASTASGNAVLVEAFRQEMRKLGWIEGNNIAIDYRFAEGQTAGQRELAAEFVRLKVDLIVVAGIGPAIAAKRETSTIPIVMASAGNPVAVGLVDSLARPGGNVTGLSTLNPELNTKRLEILKDAVAKLVRVGLLRPPPARCW